VVEPDKVRFFEHQDLYKFLTEVVDDSRSDFMQRLLYTEIAATMQREHVGSWRIGSGMSRDGKAYVFEVKNTRWFARKLSDDEAREMGLAGNQWGRSIDVMWSMPVEQILQIDAAELRVATDVHGKRALLGTIRCKLDGSRRADPSRRVDYLSLVFSSPSAKQENATRDVYQYVRPERLPDGRFEVCIPVGPGQDAPRAGRFYFLAFLFEPKASFYRISNELVWTGGGQDPPEPENRP
jgi:hypothetical protein